MDVRPPPGLRRPVRRRYQYDERRRANPRVAGVVMREEPSHAPTQVSSPITLYIQVHVAHRPIFSIYLPYGVSIFVKQSRSKQTWLTPPGRLTDLVGVAGNNRVING